MITVLLTAALAACVKINPILQVSGGSTYANVLNGWDGDTSTYASSTEVHGAQVDVRLKDVYAIKKIEVYPRPGFMDRAINGQFHAVVNASTPPDRKLVAQIPVTADLKDRWVDVPLLQNFTTNHIIYLPPAGSFGNIAEIKITAENRQFEVYNDDGTCDANYSVQLRCGSCMDLTASTCEWMCMSTSDCNFVTMTTALTNNVDQLVECTGFSDCTDADNPSPADQTMVTLQKAIYECTETPSITVLPPVATATETFVADEDDSDSILLIVLIIVIVLLCLMFLLYYFLKNRNKGDGDDYNSVPRSPEPRTADPYQNPLPAPVPAPYTPHVAVPHAIDNPLPLTNLQNIRQVTEKDSETGITSSSFTDPDTEHMVPHHISRPRRPDNQKSLTKLPPVGSTLLLKDDQNVEVIKSQSNKGMLCQYNDGERKWVPLIYVSQVLSYGNDSEIVKSVGRSRRPKTHSNTLRTLSKMTSDRKTTDTDTQSDGYSGDEHLFNDVDDDEDVNDDNWDHRTPSELIRKLGKAMHKKPTTSSIPGVSVGELQLASLQGSWGSSIGVQLVVQDEQVLVSDGREFKVSTKPEGITLNKVRVLDSHSTVSRLVWEDGEVWNRTSAPVPAGRATGLSINSKVTPALRKIDVAMRQRQRPQRIWDQL